MTVDAQILQRIADDEARPQAERDAARRQLAGWLASPAPGSRPEPASRTELLPPSLAPDPVELDREMTLMLGKRRDWKLDELSVYAQKLWEDLLSLGLLGPMHGFTVTSETLGRVRSLYETTGCDQLRERALFAIRTLANGRAVANILFPAKRPASTIARPRPRELPVTNHTCAIQSSYAESELLRDRTCRQKYCTAGNYDSASCRTRRNSETVRLEMGSALAHYEGIKAFSETDQTDDLKAITVPTLVMHRKPVIKGELEKEE